MIGKVQHPRVGTAVWICNGDKVLLGKRESGSGVDSWCPPGGGIDLYETPTQCAVREVFEETELVVRDPKLCAVMSDADREHESHWITLHFVVDYEGGEARDAAREIGNWQWFRWDELPESLFAPTRNFAKNGYNPLNFKSSKQ